MAWTGCSCGRPWPARGQLCPCIQSQLQTPSSCPRCGRPYPAPGSVCPCQSSECQRCGRSTAVFDPLLACQCSTPFLGVPPGTTVPGSPSGGGSPYASPFSPESSGDRGGQGSWRELATATWASLTGQAIPGPPQDRPNEDSPGRRTLAFSFANLMAGATAAQAFPEAPRSPSMTADSTPLFPDPLPRFPEAGPPSNRPLEWLPDPLRDPALRHRGYSRVGEGGEGGEGGENAGYVERDV